MSNCPSPDMDDLAEIFKALSNVNRLKILHRLMDCCKPGTVLQFEQQRGVSYIGELGVDLGIGKSTVSHHIKELRRVGLIKTQREGQKVKCWIDPHLVKVVGHFFQV